MSSYYSTRYSGARTRPRRRRTFFGSVMLLLWYAIVASVIGFCLYFFYQKISSPVVKYRTQAQRNREASAELQRLRKQEREIERQIKFRQSPEGAAQAARKLGWVKPGEVIIVLPNEAESASKNPQD